VGTNAVTVSATVHGAPLAGAYVCLWKGTEIFVGGTTGADGSIELPVNAATTGTLKLTVTRHNHIPVLRNITVSQPTLFVAYQSHAIDDDASGGSSGNGDGLANPGEVLEVPVQVKNFGSQTAGEVTGTISSDDPYVLILDNAEEFGNIAGGASAWSADDFDLQISEGAPHGHVVRLGLDLVSGANGWHSRVEIPVTAAAFAYDNLTIYGVGSRFDPGDVGELSVRVRNQGGASGTAVSGTLSSTSQWVTVTDDLGTFGTVGIGATGENTVDRFGIAVSAECFQGHVAPLRLALTFSGGARDTVDFALSVGAADANDPTGPDAYGYYAFDNTDAGYPDAPTYNWVEIDPAQGGTGTSFGLGDFGDAQDDSHTFTLPFAFRYYGEVFTRATVCSNGWLAMGSTYLTQYRNWNIPGAEAPAYMIAPMWDDLYQYQPGSNRVCYKNDTANHRFIVEWSRLRNNNGGATETFEVILYDPAYHPTATGDGIIVFQYNQFTNCDSQQHYCTAGIQNGNRDDGIMYSYFNYYSTGSATLQSGRAIKFTTIETVDPAAVPDAGRPPLVLALQPGSPNPFGARSGATTLRLDLPQATAVRLSVIDIGGRQVRALVDGRLEAGRHGISWDGSDAAGVRRDSGVYFVVLDAAGQRLTRRLLLVK
jgi:hypothetical protein